MPRPFCRRRIGHLPGKWRFFPEGSSAVAPEIVTLTLDELEALRLTDLLGLYHEEAAQKMGVSRATFGRILEAGRKKVAEALVSGKALRIEEGPVELVETPGLGSSHQRGIRSVPGGYIMSPGKCGYRHGPGLGPGGFCFCPQCGFKKPHQAGVPCVQERCPHCGSAMVREGSGHHRLVEEKKSEKGE